MSANNTKSSDPALRIVLVETTHPGNLGAAARAMKTMGITDMVRVRPQADLNEEARARASGAEALLETARVCDHLEEAVADCTWVAGTTARRRHYPWPVLSPREWVQESITAPRSAVVFGRESRGLSNADLERCTHVVRIPCDESFPSLNMAAAVQILCYEWCLATGADIERMPTELPATAGELAQYFRLLEQWLDEAGFFVTDNPEPVMRHLRDLFTRSRLTSKEIHLLLGVLQALSKR